MRERLLCVCVTVFVWVPLPSWAEDPINIPDARLKATIEGCLCVPDPTPTDMLAMTSLTVRGAGISDLTGLEYAVNLQSLDLRENRISDISPLGGLTNLESLNLSMNRIASVSPLSGLTNLTTLDVHDNHSVSDISPLAGLIKLQSLTLRHNTISVISVLSGMSELRYLDMFENKISDISSLTSLYCLSYVDLRSNPLGEGACETAIATILANNPDVNLRYDRCGPRQILITATCGGQVISPGEGEFEYANGELICLQAQADPCFVFVGWSGSTTSTDNPMMYMMQGDQQIRANFMSLMDELHVDDNDPNDPSPGDPEVGNSRENGSRRFPFDSIQEAIDVAKSGATILVRPGTYRESLNLSGKQIRLLGIDSKNPNGGPCVIVEGRAGGPVIRVSSNRGTECSLSGFVLTRGRGQSVAAVSCSGASLMLDKCLVVGNRCSSIEGAILYFEDCRPVLTNCTIADNYAGQDGAGLVLEDSDIIMSSSILWGNYPVEISSRGESKPSIHYCDVRGWWPALWNLMSDPLFARPGCWVDPMNPTLVLEYTDLRATWKDGDYHLKSQGGRWDPGLGSWVHDDVTSCGIDTGDPTSLLGFEPMPNGGVINMGVYGGTNEASKSP